MWRRGALSRDANVVQTRAFIHELLAVLERPCKFECSQHYMCRKASRQTLKYSYIPPEVSTVSTG